MKIKILFPGSGSEVTDLGCLGSTCYWLVGKAIRFSEAGSACAMVNETSLVPASILDDVTNTYLTSQITLVGKVSYIGAIAKSFPWKWTSGEALEGEILQTQKHYIIAELFSYTLKVY